MKLKPRNTNNYAQRVAGADRNVHIQGMQDCRSGLQLQTNIITNTISADT